MSHPTVFVVDHNARIRESISELLSAARLEVRTFDSAGAFLSAYVPAVPGCLVLDLLTALGFGLLEELPGKGVSLPVIVLSRAVIDTDAARALELGCFDFIRKPFAPEILLERVQKALHQTG